MRHDVIEVESPVGTLVVTASDDGLHAVRFAVGAGSPGTGSGGSARPVAERLARYFDGDLAALDDVRVVADGTPFQRRVWAELRRIPAGTCTSYGALAAAIGRPGAARAVGAANALNPVAIVVPCHRVIGADGTLTGYAGGLERKRWLLRHERGDTEAGTDPSILHSVLDGRPR